MLLTISSKEQIFVHRNLKKLYSNVPAQHDHTKRICQLNTQHTIDKYSFFEHETCEKIDTKAMVNGRNRRRALSDIFQSSIIILSKAVNIYSNFQ